MNYSTWKAWQCFAVVHGKHWIAPSDLEELKSSTASTKALSSALVTKSNVQIQWRLKCQQLTHWRLCRLKPPVQKTPPIPCATRNSPKKKLVGTIVFPTLPLKIFWFFYCSVVLEDKYTNQNRLTEHIFRGLKFIRFVVLFSYNRPPRKELSGH